MVGNCYDLLMLEKTTGQKRSATAGTRRGSGRGHGGPAKGQGIWGAANGMGWGGPSQGGSQARARPMTTDERDRLRHEMVDLYLGIARDSTQSAMMRLQAARHLLERLDNLFDEL